MRRVNDFRIYLSRVNILAAAYRVALVSSVAKSNFLKRFEFFSGEGVIDLELLFSFTWSFSHLYLESAFNQRLSSKGMLGSVVERRSVDLVSDRLMSSS